MTPGPGGRFEHGLQRERTVLAWIRTALSLIVAGSLLIQHLGPPYVDVFHLPAYAALVAGLVFMWLATRDSRWRTKTNPYAVQLRPWRAWGVGITTFILNVASLLIVAVGR